MDNKRRNNLNRMNTKNKNKAMINILNMKSKHREGYHGRRGDTIAYTNYIKTKAQNLTKRTGVYYYHPNIPNLYS